MFGIKNVYDIPKILEKNEKIVYEGKPNYKAYMLTAIVGILIAIFVIGIFAFSYSIILGIVVSIAIFVLGIIGTSMAYARTHYAITNKRVIIQTGIIGRDFRSIPFDMIKNASVNVGVLGVIFKVGDVQIFTGEIESHEIGGFGGRYSTAIRPKYDKFSNVASPYEVLKILQEQMSKYKGK